MTTQNFQMRKMRVKRKAKMKVKRKIMKKDYHQAKKNSFFPFPMMKINLEWFNNKINLFSVSLFLLQNHDFREIYQFESWITFKEHPSLSWALQSWNWNGAHHKLAALGWQILDLTLTLLHFSKISSNSSTA